MVAANDHPKQQQQERDHPLPTRGETKVYETPDGAPYVLCRNNDNAAFANPTSQHLSAAHVNAQLLNLNLGQKLVTRNNQIGYLLLWLARKVDVFLIQWWEQWAMYVWSEMVPLKVKRLLIQVAWKIVFPLHKHVLGKSTGLHSSQSYEYHCLTTILFPSQFLAWTPRRMRFFLGELYTNAPNDPPAPERVERINEDVGIRLKLSPPPKEQANHMTVRGWYIRQSSATDTTSSKKGTIFWIYGGAYLSGDARGNSSVADYIGVQQTDMDVFVPTFRLAPEANLFDVLWDICLAFWWLQSRLRAAGDEGPVFVLGISSGAAVATRLLQLIASSNNNDNSPPDGRGNVPDYFAPLLQKLHMPRGGGVLFAPYVDYGQLHPHEQTGSFLHYSHHDLVVNRAVQEYGLPYLADFIPALDGDSDNLAARRRQSPIHLSCRGLPPLLVLVSEHEAVYDMTCALVNRARRDGVDVTIGVWKYMCHVFSMLHGFFPEAQISMDVVVQWLRERQRQELEQSSSSS